MQVIATCHRASDHMREQNGFAAASWGLIADAAGAGSKARAYPR
jgi:uncharacterized membrane-anchored protein